MHTPAAIAAVAAVLTLGSAPAVADDAVVKLELEVGQRATVGGASGRCDDASVATITLDAQAVITALKPGRTTCSARVGGLLRVYEVRVTAPPPGGGPAAPGKPGDAGKRERT